MPAIQMVDLHSQYIRQKAEIDEAIEKVLLSGTFIRGAEVSAFEEGLAAYTGAGHVITCGNGTDALMLAFMALDLPAGAEVITPSFSYAAVAETLMFLGLRPVFAEVDRHTYLLDPESLESLITERTAGIVPVHLFGQCCNMEAILKVAQQHRLFVVEDAAQAIGSVYTFSDGRVRQAGTMGNIGTTSFFPTKNLGCYGDGGAVFCNDAALAEKLRMLGNHGQRKKYHHEILGINSRLDALQAAVLNVKLKVLEEYHSRRRRAAKAYDEALHGIAGLELPAHNPQSTHVFHQYTLRLADRKTRDGLKNFLAEAGIPTMVYYPLPLHMQPAYAQDVAMPLTGLLSETVLSLPMHTELSEDQIHLITQKIKAYFKA